MCMFKQMEEKMKDFHCLKIVWIFQTYSNYTTLLQEDINPIMMKILSMCSSNFSRDGKTVKFGN